MTTCVRSDLGLMQELGEIVRRLREKHSLSQEELAGKAGLSRATVQNLEGGKISEKTQAKTIRKLAQVFRLEPEQFRAMAKGPMIVAFDQEGQRFEVPPDAVTAATSGASLNKQTLGDWLTAMLRRAANSPAASRLPDAPGIVRTKAGHLRREATGR